MAVDGGALKIAGSVPAISPRPLPRPRPHNMNGPAGSPTIGLDVPPQPLSLSRKSQSFLVRPPGASPVRTKSMLSMVGTPGSSEKSSAQPDSNIRVAVRCRPLSVEEKKADATAAVLCNSEKNSITINHALAGGIKKVARTWDFDKVYGMYSTQMQIFQDVVQPVIAEAIQGYNCTVFAYGPTGTGKTYTMEGDLSEESAVGMIPRGAQAIFDQLAAMTGESTVKISMLEIYNEELRDLLSTGDRRLKLMEDLRRGVVCANLEEFVVKNMAEVMDHLRKGSVVRQTAATKNNLHSSRSHTIFTFHIIIDGFEKQGDDYVKHGQINFVDLAGSECIGRSGAKDERAREAGSINQSLLTLGRVISALVDFHPHVPYRDSKLTRLLQESLGGKAKTVIIATLSPAVAAAEESSFTIDYAFRARSVKNQPQTISQTASKTAIKHYLQEIESLKQQLAATREKNGVYMDQNDFVHMQAKLVAQENMLEESEATIRMRDGEISAMKSELDQLAVENGTQREQIDSLSTQVAGLTEKLDSAGSRLQATFVQLQASRAVVAEQADAEKAHLQQGEQLAGAVREREEDIKKLLDKVARLENQEQARLAHTQAFVRDLQGSHASLTQQLLGLMSQTEQQSDALGRGVQTMLAQGRDNFATIQHWLREALTALQASAAGYKEDMLYIAGDIDGEVKSLAQDSKQQAQDSQKLWESQVDALLQKLSHGVTLIATQEKLAEDTLSSVNEHFGVMQDMHTAFQKTQEAGNKDLQAQFRALRLSLEAHLLKYDREAIKQLDDVQQHIASGAQQIQKTVEDMMRELVSSSSAMITEAKSKAATLCKTLSTESAEGFSKLELFGKKQLDESLLQIDKQIIWTKTTRSSLTDHVRRVEQPRGETKALLASSFPADVQELQRALVRDLGALTSAHEKRAAGICASVEKQQKAIQAQSSFMSAWKSEQEQKNQGWSEKADKDLQGGSEKLRAEIDTARLQTHGFSNLQQASLGEAMGQTKDHLVKANEMTLTPRGDSPTRLIVASIIPLVPTRSHVDITSEVLRQHAASGQWKDQIEELTQKLEQLLASM